MNGGALQLSSVLSASDGEQTKTFHQAAPPVHTGLLKYNL